MKQLFIWLSLFGNREDLFLLVYHFFLCYGILLLLFHTLSYLNSVYESFLGSRGSKLIYMEFVPIDLIDNDLAFYASIYENGYYGLTK